MQCLITESVFPIAVSCCALTTDTQFLTVQVTVWAGVFPIVVSWWAAVALTAFIVAQTLVTSFCRNRKHLKPLWFNSVSNNILWFTFVKVSLPVPLIPLLLFTGLVLDY